MPWMSELVTSMCVQQCTPTPRPKTSSGGVGTTHLRIDRFLKSQMHSGEKRRIAPISFVKNDSHFHTRTTQEAKYKSSFFDHALHTALPAGVRISHIGTLCSDFVRPESDRYALWMSLGIDRQLIREAGEGAKAHSCCPSIRCQVRHACGSGAVHRDQ
jgi:hypothetical protein